MRASAPNDQKIGHRPSYSRWRQQLFSGSSRRILFVFILPFGYMYFFGSRLLPFSLVSLTGGSFRKKVSASATCQTINMMQDYPIGLGTYQINPDQVPDAITSAIQSGYRRIDCAPVYFNEDKIGDALADEFASNRVDRTNLFIVSKLANPFHRKEHVKIGLKKTLLDLRLDYLDLFLIHWPQAFHYVDVDLTKRGYKNEDIDDSNGGKLIDPTVSVHETWKAMEELVDEGLVRAIGVSNFPVSLLHELLTSCRIPPAVNQVEMHPYLQQTKLLEYCNTRGVHLQAYSPLGTPGNIEDGEPRILDDPVLKMIANNHKVTVAQVSIAWSMQRGTSAVVKSASAQRQEENLSMTKDEYAIDLSPEEMKQIAALDRGYRFFRPEDWWGGMAMAVFD